MKNKHFELHATGVLHLQDAALLECQTSALGPPSSRRLSLSHDPERCGVRCARGDKVRGETRCAHRDVRLGGKPGSAAQKDWPCLKQRPWRGSAGAEAAARAPGLSPVRAQLSRKRLHKPPRPPAVEAGGWGS